MQQKAVLSVTALLLTMTAGMGCSAGSQPGDEDGDFSVEQIAAGTTPFQLELLADGEVTFAEYERATLAAIACLEGAGLVVDGPYPRNGVDSRFLEYSYGFDEIPPDQRESMSQRMIAAGDDCEREYRYDVARVWEYQHLLAPEERERQRELLIDCLQAGGVDIADTASDEDIYRVSADPGIAAVRQCREAYPDFYVVDVE
jgi:hypothetical protein